jgi:ABC-type arginine transport system permease subunit
MKLRKANPRIAALVRAVLIPAILAGMAALAPMPAGADSQQTLRDALKRMPGSFQVNGQAVAMRPIRDFYDERGYLPAWTTDSGWNE